MVGRMSVINMHKRLELSIETLTGGGFKLHVYPYETVQDVKAMIQREEGIPISHQHLIWQGTELENDYCLSDYPIQDGATLKLVLNMRGGPINTRRIPMDEPSIYEMAEYFSEASRDEPTDKLSNRPVTVIVYHNGDQLNFFRVVDRDSTSPMSESLSGASMYNMYDEEEDDETPTKEKVEENDKTREKMKLLKTKMENLTLTKKPKKKFVPRPPSSGRPCSKAHLRRVVGPGARKSTSLNRNQCLPPVGQTLEGEGAADGSVPRFDPSTIQAAKERFDSAAAASEDKVVLTASLGLQRLESVENAKLKPSLASVQEHRAVGEEGAEGEEEEEQLEEDGPQHNGCGAASTNCDTSSKNVKPSALSKEAILRRAQSSLQASRKWDFSHELLLKNEPKPPRKRDQVAHDSYSLRPVTSTNKGLEKHVEKAEIDASGPGRPVSRSKEGSSASGKENSLAGKNDNYSHVLTTSSKYGSERRQGGVVLESLNASEVRVVSGMLSSLVRSASKSRAGYALSSSGYKDVGHVTTPEGRLVSGRLRRLSASRERRVISPSHRLPPVKQKKKVKRCSVCGKKTGLTNAYSCRCSNNFCAAHRYPEAHSCTFDYKTEGRKLLEQNNPVVTAPKLPKI